MTVGDPISVYMDAGPKDSGYLWAVAQAACDFIGFDFVKMLDLTLTDGPWPKDERVESVSLAFGPPILHELRLILMFIEDTRKEAARKAEEAR